MSTPKYRLTYFNFKSLGEPIRWVLAYAGIPYEDDRVPTDFIAWFTQRKAGTLVKVIYVLLQRVR